MLGNVMAEAVAMVVGAVWSTRWRREAQKCILGTSHELGARGRCTEARWCVALLSLCTFIGRIGSFGCRRHCMRIPGKAPQAAEPGTKGVVKNDLYSNLELSNVT
jgi:hypothetical protein